MQDAWGIWRTRDEGRLGSLPMHDAEHLVCSDIDEWEKCVKAPLLAFSGED